MEFDLVIIGSGPGGYIAAIRAAQMGFKVACVEKDKTLGGTCLNVGCIPSKALLESSHHFYSAKKDFEHHGIKISDLKLNLDVMIKRKNDVVKTLTGGVDMLFKKNKVTRLNGWASFISATEILVKSETGEEKVKAKNFIIATGSVPSSLPGITIDEKDIVSSTGALDFPELPKKLAVIGGGYIGLEMASVWSRLGSEVTVVEFQNTIIPNMDVSLQKGLLKALQAQGLKFEFEAAVKKIDKSGSELSVIYEKAGKTLTLNCNKVLMSVGRKPFIEKLGLDKIGVQIDPKGFIKASQQFQTSVPNIYAIGDVIGGLMLAHKAEEEGVACVEMIKGEKPEIEYNLVPQILYTFPEVASVGKTEAQLKKENREFKTGQFSLRANGRAISSGETEGFVKVIGDPKTHEILGAHIFAPNASEMIHEFCVAMEFNATVDDIALTMHGHPTLSESIKEANLNFLGRTLNS